MIDLAESDFRLLEQWKYLWMWTDSEPHTLPFSDFTQIHLLKRERAQFFWEYNYAYNVELSHYAFVDTSKQVISSLFTWIQHIDVHQKSLTEIQQHLAVLQQLEDQSVLVMWEPEEAVAVPWQILYTYWDKFCDAADEGMCVLPLSEVWMLLYHHKDQLVMGESKLPLLDTTTREKVWNPPSKPLKSEAHNEILRLLQTHQKIAAIKLYHQETGVNLRKAKEVVDHMLSENQHIKIVSFYLKPQKAMY